MKSILILLHCESNVGFAIAPLELAFYKMALALCDHDASRVHFAYPTMENGPTATLPTEFRNYLVFDPNTQDADTFDRVGRYLRDHNIDTLFGFDQPVSLPIYKAYRQAGIRTFISYWGAPMSSLMNPLILAAKRVEVLLRTSGPDHYIFESKGMADTAVRGRGVPASRVTVIPQGVDLNRFRPDETRSASVHETLGIEQERHFFFYSGHMEERKGVAVIMAAANHLAMHRRKADWHIALFGNRADEHLPLWNLLNERARNHVTFYGYRNDLDEIQRGAFAAIIASTGWDSFPRSALEAQSSGLPLLASDLPGLKETIEDGVTGLLFPAGHSLELARAMTSILDDRPLRNVMSANARQRAIQNFSLQAHHESLVATVRRVTGRRDH